MKAKPRGFTMVELVTVLVLLGILSVAIVPRMMSSADTAAPIFRADILSALRYAQKVSVSHRRLVCANIAAGSITLTIAQANPPAAGCNAALPSPDNSPYSSKDPAVTAANNIAGSTLFFQPNGDILDGNSALANGQITISGQAAIVIDGGGSRVE
ncbi:prepilin-type N-terminal cleavage/methylation domain-containing protein [Massilia sp. erpn]|uniref:prepilin-type N-terminal cleavage/methylation domain-containing protein n=1 Tax=Massilia sp. erpn TaxID=2738142 RepID=UPI00210451FB|nr:prepilin-type N-terminal cleavage/methylation domain-containing protein [Massilia sp. erpn]UTY59872.1 prepilin-type N-terminal cleavage/methylation domain-containing protein [Massilia sp. erpn]